MCACLPVDNRDILCVYIDIVILPVNAILCSISVSILMNTILLSSQVQGCIRRPMGGINSFHVLCADRNYKSFN